MSTGTSEPIAVVRIDGRLATVTVAGEIDLATAPSLSDCIESVLADPGVTRVCVDLERCTFLDSIGLHALVAARSRAADEGRIVTLRRPTELVRRVLCAAGVSELFPMETA